VVCEPVYAEQAAPAAPALLARTIAARRIPVLIVPLCRAAGILPYIPPRCKSGRLRASALVESAVNSAFKWMGIVVAAGVLLMYIEYHFAKKKKEGYTPIDRQRIIGIFWLTIFFSLLVGVVVYFSD
jgi:hypothetical protein